MGVAALLAGAVALGLGLGYGWRSFELIGIGLFAVLAIAAIIIARPSQLSIDRQIQPPRVPKGSPAIAFLTFANRGRATIGVTVANQPFGPMQVRTVIPRLRRGERGVRTYRLPTTRRGIFDVGPVEVTRRDPFDLFRVSRRHGEIERIWVFPRILSLRPLQAGHMRNLEGPSSDLAPQGTVTFHRLRDYVAGDDLRLVHWRSSARTGKLVVKHNVDTSQPYSVVLLDQRPDRYTEQSFEEAVDIAASAVVTCSANKAPVELRQSDGTRLGGPRLRDITPLIDQLTAVQATADGSLRAELLALRRLRGGSSLIVVTGVLDRADLPFIGLLRRRFDQIVLVSIDVEHPHPMHVPGVRLVVGTDADDARDAWNVQVHT
jgi:uncharacterized protein (DUF58 family)